MPETDGPQHDKLPGWRPRPDLEIAQLANALEHIRRSAYSHWLGDEFEDEHKRNYALIAAQALCGQPIEAPVDLNSPEFKASVEADHERLMQLFDDDLDQAATTVEPHEHDFQPDTDRPHTLYCTAARCQVLKSSDPGHHPYRELRHPERHLVAIDEHLADLVERMWKAGVETFGSCQGGCCQDTEGTVSKAWLVYNAAHANTALPLLAALPGLKGDGYSDGRVRVSWDAPERCPAFEQEQMRRKIGAELVGARIDWEGRRA